MFLKKIRVLFNKNTVIWCLAPSLHTHMSVVVPCV